MNQNPMFDHPQNPMGAPAAPKVEPIAQGPDVPKLPVAVAVPKAAEPPGRATRMTTSKRLMAWGAVGFLSTALVLIGPKWFQESPTSLASSSEQQKTEKPRSGMKPSNGKDQGTVDPGNAASSPANSSPRSGSQRHDMKPGNDSERDASSATYHADSGTRSRSPETPASGAQQNPGADGNHDAVAGSANTGNRQSEPPPLGDNADASSSATSEQEGGASDSAKSFDKEAYEKEHAALIQRQLKIVDELMP